MHNQPVADAALVACPHCDLLQRLPQLAAGTSARCARCDEELLRPRADSYRRTFALTIAAAILLAVANSVPMLGLTILGREASTTVIGGAQHLWSDGRETVAALVLFTAVIAPVLQVAFMLGILFGARRDRVPRWVSILLRYYRITATWSMIEVMLLGVLVALVKIADYATVIPGLALFTLGGVVVLFAAMEVTFDPDEVWARIEWADDGARARAAAADRVAEVRG